MALSPPPLSSLLFNWCRGSFPEKRRPRCDIHHSLPSNAKVKNVWRGAATPPHAFMATLTAYCNNSVQFSSVQTVFINRRLDSTSDNCKIRTITTTTTTTTIIIIIIIIIHIIPTKCTFSMKMVYLSRNM